MKKISLLKLTRKEILNDIEVYKKRIRAAAGKIAELPQRTNGYKELKKLKFKRRILEQEIGHVKELIAIASEMGVSLSAPLHSRMELVNKRSINR
jgi:phage gp16-like protein